MANLSDKFTSYSPTNSSATAGAGGGTASLWELSGDVELDSKPTWAF